MTALHKPPAMNGKLDTTIAYQVMFYPWSKLSVNAERAIAWHKSLVVTKEKLLDMLDEEQTEIYLSPCDEAFDVRWEYNNIPTQEEWKALSDKTQIRVQFRISSIAGGNGRAAILALVDSKTKQNV